MCQHELLEIKICYILLLDQEDNQERNGLAGDWADKNFCIWAYSLCAFVVDEYAVDEQRLRAHPQCGLHMLRKIRTIATHNLVSVHCKLQSATSFEC